MIRVIVADDEKKVCDLIIHLIEWEKLEMELVGTASNGEEALKMIEEKKADLVLTDIRMPGYSGLELMQKAREICPEVEFIIISGHSLFEYAQTAIQYGVQDYILKPVNQKILNATLQKARKRYLEKHTEDQAAYQDLSRFFKVIWYDLENEELPQTIDDANEKYFCNFKKGTFEIFCIHEDFKNYKNISLPYYESTYDVLLTKAEAAMDIQIKPLCYEFTLDNHNGDIYGILNFDSSKQKPIHEALMHVVNDLSIELQTFEDIQIHLSLSKSATEFRLIQACQNDAKRAMDQRVFLPKESLLSNAPIDAVIPEEQIFKTFISSLKKSIELQNSDQLANAITALKKEILTYSISGSQLIKLIQTAYNLFLFSGMSQSIYQFYPAEEAMPEFNQKVALCSNADDLFNLLNAVCVNDLETACQWIDQEKIRPINMAKEYILENYAQPLSLDEICSKVGFSASYFSTLFRKETGTTFSEYLNNVRMEAAKKRLRETNQTIESICESVGIHDYKRFSKRFKADAGISPREYRKLYS